MTTSSLRSRALVLSSVLAGWTLLALACSVEEENPASNRVRGTEAGATSSGSTGAVGEQPTGAPLCDKYGGTPQVTVMADGLVARLMSDCRVGLVVENGRKRAQQHFDDCFRQFVGGGFKCPGVSFTAGTTKDNEDRVCNKPLESVTFSTADFNAAMEVVAATLKEQGMSDDDIRAVAPVFEGARLRMVDDDLPRNKHRQCKPDCNLAKGDACVQPIIDAGPDTGPIDDAGNDEGDGGGDIEDAATEQDI